MSGSVAKISGNSWKLHSMLRTSKIRFVPNSWCLHGNLGCNPNCLNQQHFLEFDDMIDISFGWNTFNFLNILKYIFDWLYTVKWNIYT